MVKKQQHYNEKPKNTILSGQFLKDILNIWLLRSLINLFLIVLALISMKILI